MYMHVILDDNEDLAIWASILVGFFGLLRRKNLVPEDLEDIDTFKILTVTKIKLDINRVSPSSSSARSSWSFL